MTSPPTAAGAFADVRGLSTAALVVLGVGFLLTAVGSVWTVLTPLGTGVNFPAGATYVLGMTVGAVGLVLGAVALVANGRAARRR